MDSRGDLGKSDRLRFALRAADTIIFLDFSLWCCAHRAFRRSRERIDFWWCFVLSLAKPAGPLESHRRLRAERRTSRISQPRFAAAVPRPASPYSLKYRKDGPPHLF